MFLPAPESQLLNTGLAAVGSPYLRDETRALHWGRRTWSSVTGASYLLILTLAPGAHCRAVPKLSCMELAALGKAAVLSSATNPPWNTEAHAEGLKCSLTWDAEHLRAIKMNV